MWLFPCCWYNFLLTSQGHREGVSFSLSWTSASASLSSAHPHRDAGATPELGRRQHTHRPSEGRKSPDHQNYFWRDLLALSPLAPLKAENRAEHPEGKKEDERIFLPKGRRDHYQSHSEKIRKSYTKQRGRLFPSEGTNCKLAEHLDNNFLSPTHLLITPHRIKVTSAHPTNALGIQAGPSSFGGPGVNLAREKGIAVTGGWLWCPICGGKARQRRDGGGEELRAKCAPCCWLQGFHVPAGEDVSPEAGMVFISRNKDM